MHPHEALAFVAGYVLISDLDREGEPPKIEDSHRAKLKEFLGLAEKFSKGFLTVTVRWLILNVEGCDMRTMANEVLRAWVSRPPSFTELCMLMKGYFDVTGGTALTPRQASILLSEIDRNDSGMPPRFQQLYFELASFVRQCADAKSEAATVDIAVVKEAFGLNQVDFPSLDIRPKAEPSAPPDAEAPKKKEAARKVAPVEAEAGPRATKRRPSPAKDPDAVAQTPKNGPAAEATSGKPVEL